ncbi:MAG: TonB-dependent receptor [Novosphingobium sp.]|nr:TonB-dependent receptor [Novosphingobium sp.]
MRFCTACSAIALTAAALGIAPQALAQDIGEDSARDGRGSLDEIVATARRVAENLQSVPVAVTAFSGEELRSQGARTALDIQALTPNLKIREGGGNPTSLVLAIRGQIQTDIISTLDPSIGVYVDEVYYARAMGLNSGLLDLAQVEVLKGPQGTLFGRNTTGGALNITTNKPDAGALGGSFRMNIGNHGRFDTEAVLNVPLVRDKLALRLGGQRQKSNGYGRDLVSGQRLAETDNYTIRGKLRWTPDDRLDVVVSGERFNLGQNGPVQGLVYVSPTNVINNPLLPYPLTIPATPEIIAALTTGGCFDTALLAGAAPTFRCAGPSTYTPGSRTFASYMSADPYEVSLTSVPRVKARTSTVSVNASYDLGGATLKYIGAYRKIANTNPIDLDGTPFTILQTETFQKSHSWSHEFQLAGQAFGDRLDYTVGAYRFTESGSDGSTSFALPVINPNNPSATRGFVASKALAFYGQGTLHATDALSLTAGLRWSQDKKRLDSRSTVGGNCVVPVALRNNPSTPCSAIFRRTDDAVSYTASANYQLADTVMTYVKTSRGFRGGGFNLRGTSVLSFTPFDPEEVTDYEFGIKSEFLDRRARLNIALFTSDYKDIQKSTIVSNGQGGTATIVANAASARVKGLVSAVSTNGTDLRL